MIRWMMTLVAIGALTGCITQSVVVANPGVVEACHDKGGGYYGGGGESSPCYPQCPDDNGQCHDC